MGNHILKPVIHSQIIRYVLKSGFISGLHIEYNIIRKYHLGLEKIGLRPDFTSKLVHVLAFGTPKFYIAPYDKIKHKLVNLSSNCDVKSGLNSEVVLISNGLNSEILL